MGCRLTTTAPWRTVAATATGSAHTEREEEGQDAVAVAHLADGGVAVAVADGAGSAPLSAEGSSAAVAVATSAIAEGASVAEAFELAACALGEDAAARATTLLVAVLRDEAVEVGQVGDGFIVTRAGGGYAVAVPCPPREYLNETVFLSSPSWRDDFRHAHLEGVEALALLTDGLQLVAIELATDTPFAGFFDPVFSWAAAAAASDDELAAFLRSPRVAARTDDDVTLAVVVRAT